MFRFDAKQGYYLYPDTEDREDLKLFLNKGSKYESNVQARNDIFVVKPGESVPVDAVIIEGETAVDESAL